MRTYDHKAIEKKWQDAWEESKIFQVKEDKSKKKYYVLEMYPYPSASSMHMGHARNYTIGDIYARFKRMNGFNVLYPMGYDAFGLPAENAAIKQHIHPREYTEAAIASIKKQQKELGLSYDWSRELASCYPEYYKWNQYFFLKLIEKDLAYRKKAPINWCPKCETVLANEQVEDGKCWRCNSEIEIKPLEQWFFRITKYADRLIDDLKLLENKWSDKIISMQRNWIGKSEGTEIQFKIEGTEDIIPVFTTRIDTIFGVTFVVYAPEHPKVMELVRGTEYEEDVKEFVKKVVLEDKFERTDDSKEKEGMFIGKYAINPVTGDRVPIYIGNFVLLEYGAGAVMAVPAHDSRDFDFAKKYNIPVKTVITKDGHSHDVKDKAFVEDGKLVNSGQFDGMENRKAIPELQKYLEHKKIGKKITQYKIRDWLISRQRYWGTPIPVVYCNKCGMVPVHEKDLPILLPMDIRFGEGNPLKTSATFLHAKCPKCGGEATRETDTMDGFMDSNWYFLRFTSPGLMDKPFDKEKVKYWLPVDQYIGGAEHAVMHLLYARFFVKILKDLGIVDIDEPFERLFNQGIVYKDGAKMSKSKGNVVSQEEISNKYGIDTARLFLMFIASPDKVIEWSDSGIEGSYRSLNKLFALLEKCDAVDIDSLTESKMHRAIKDVTDNITTFEYNKAIIALMEFTNYLSSKEVVPKAALETLVKLIAPFTPHLAEEMWEILCNKGFISLEKWPHFDESKLDIKAEHAEKVISSVVKDIRNVIELVKIENPKSVKLIVSSKWKYELFGILKEKIITEGIRDPKVLIAECLKHNSLKVNGGDVIKIISNVLKDQSKMPEFLFTQEEELMAIESSRQDIAKLIGSGVSVTVELADNSSEKKAGNASPSRPAILVE